MINTVKPTTLITNSAKVATGETWASILTTWASETRNWLEVGSFIDNTTRQTSSIINVAKPI